MENILNLRGCHGRSLLAFAAFRGDKATFEAVLTSVQKRLPSEQVQATISFNTRHVIAVSSRTAGGVLVYYSKV